MIALINIFPSPVFPFLVAWKAATASLKGNLGVYRSEESKDTSRGDFEPVGDQRLKVESSLGGECDGQFVVSRLNVR